MHSIEAPWHAGLDAFLQEPSFSVEARFSSISHQFGLGFSVIQVLGPLARATWKRSPEALSLDVGGKVGRPDSKHARFQIPQGEWFPQFDRTMLQKQGAFDTPAEQARRLVYNGLKSTPIFPASGLDPSCGVGALLVAMAEAGVKKRIGVEVDPLACIVARAADPGARVILGNGLLPHEEADLVVANPPFIPAEKQERTELLKLHTHFPWLKGRYDLSLVFVGVCLESLSERGILSILLPESIGSQPYAARFREWVLKEFDLVQWSAPKIFQGVSTRVVEVVVAKKTSNVPVPEIVRSARALPQHPFSANLREDDGKMLRRILNLYPSIEELAQVDTGVVVHGKTHHKSALIFREPGEGRRLFADANDFFRGGKKWLAYRPELMHRPKEKIDFSLPKLVFQRILGRGSLKVAIDREGIMVGHTCLVVVPKGEVDLDSWLTWFTDPVMLGFLRVLGCFSFDLYPKILRSVPLPSHGKEDLSKIWGLSTAEIARWRELAWVFDVSGGVR